MTVIIASQYFNIRINLFEIINYFIFSLHVSCFQACVNSARKNFRLVLETV